MREDIEVDVVVAGAGACGVMTALRASREPRHRRRGPREEHDRGVQRRRLQRQPRCGRNPLPNARRASRTQPSGTPADILANSRRRAAPGPRHGALRGRPRLRALDRRRPRLPHGRRHRHGTQGHVGAAPARRPRARRRRPAHQPPAQDARRPAQRRPRSTRPPSPACASRTALSSVSRARQGSHDLVVQRGVTVLATDGFAGNRALMQEYCAELGDPFHGGVSTATGDSIGWLRAARRRVPQHGRLPAPRPGDAARDPGQPGPPLARRRPRQPARRALRRRAGPRLLGPRRRHPGTSPASAP